MFVYYINMTWYELLEIVLTLTNDKLIVYEDTQYSVIGYNTLNMEEIFI